MSKVVLGHTIHKRILVVLFTHDHQNQLGGFHTFVLRERHVSHAREALGTRRCEAHRALGSTGSIVRKRSGTIVIKGCISFSVGGCRWEIIATDRGDPAKAAMARTAEPTATLLR